MYERQLRHCVIARRISVPLIGHNPRKGEKKELAPYEAQRYKSRSGAERCNARLKDEFGARHVQVRGHDGDVQLDAGGGGAVRRSIHKVSDVTPKRNKSAKINFKTSSQGIARIACEQKREN